MTEERIPKISSEHFEALRQGVKRLGFRVYSLNDLISAAREQGDLFTAKVLSEEALIYSEHHVKAKEALSEIAKIVKPSKT